MTVVRDLAGEADTAVLAGELAACRPAGALLTLSGPLGAGKTTLARELLRALGVRGAVRSPSYTLLEHYDTAIGPAAHLDLYRLGDPEELEYLGVRELFDSDTLCLIEWPERAAARLPPADLAVAIAFRGAGRQAALSAGTPAGARLVAAVGGPAPGDGAREILGNA